MSVPHIFEPDLEQAAEFLSVLGERHTFQVFGERAGCTQHPKILHGSAGELLPRLAQLNKNGAGIFFMVNEGDGLGRKTENVQEVRALVLDLDGSPLDPVHHFPLEPHLIVESSPGRWHAYWRVVDFPLAQFSIMQSALAAHFDGDPAVKDLPRVMRVPGFYHWKKEPFLSHVLENNNLPPYTLAEFQRSLNVQSAAKPVSKQGTTSETKQGNVSEREPVQEPDKPDLTVISGECSFVKHCIEDAKTLTEPHWYSFLKIAARCHDGGSLVHFHSKVHPRYDFSATERKAAHALADAGPHTCQYIKDLTGSQYCESCPNRGKVKSPIVLGRGKREASDLEKAMEEVNGCCGVVLLGNKVQILYEGADGNVKFLSRADFMSMFANRHVKVVGKKEPVNVGAAWFAWEKRKEWKGVVFAPGQEVPGFYNLYRGLACQPQPGDWSLYREHVRKVISSGDETTFQWILAWMARIVQDPGGKRPGVAIVLRGKQGTGKGVFVFYFGSMFGPHFVQINNQKQLTGNFNNILQGSLVVFCDEAIWAGDKTAEGVLKGFITESTLVIEPKGKDAYSVDNYANLIIATNNSWAAPAGMEERRFFVTDVSDEHLQDAPYFDAITQQMENGGREAMLHDLLQMDVSGVDLRKFPRTKALLDQIVASVDAPAKFWVEKLFSGNIDDAWDGRYEDTWPKIIPSDVLYRHYLDFAKSLGERYHQAPSQFAKRLFQLCPGMGKVKRPNADNKRVWCYRLPPLDVCRSFFSSAVNMSVDWDEGVQAEKWSDSA